MGLSGQVVEGSPNATLFNADGPDPLPTGDSPGIERNNPRVELTREALEDARPSLRMQVESVDHQGCRDRVAPRVTQLDGFE